VLDGEGVGPEVIRAALRVLDAVQAATGIRFDIRRGGTIGLAAERAHGRVLTAETVEFCRDVFAAGGAILCGPGGGRFVYDLRAEFDLFCKMVPLNPMPALRNAGPMKASAVGNVDILVLRENTAGLYHGASTLERGPAGLKATHRFEYSSEQVRRILRTAIAASELRRRRLCVITKPAGVPAISELWQSEAGDLAVNYAIELQFMEIDTACYRLIAEAREFDVVVTPNMFGDVLADAATVLLGSRGMSYSGNFAADGSSVYQTGHGAAMDLAGTDRANPVGQICSLIMMLHESFGLTGVAATLTTAVNDTLAAGWRTADIAEHRHGVIGTQALAERIAEAAADRLTAGGLPPADGATVG
jgi:3-isopropylmalate dehydrogenase